MLRRSSDDDDGDADDDDDDADADGDDDDDDDAAEPRAPECAIIQTELIGSPSLAVEIPFIISSATRSEHRDHTSTTLLYFSPWVIRPSRYCCSNVLTSASASLTYFSFSSGVVRSAMPNEIPASQA